MPNKLSDQEILRLLSMNGQKHDFQVIVKDSIPSTNDYLMDVMLAQTESLPKTALLAETQTAGKGRQGRSWVSVPGNILLSVYWPFECKLDALYGLSLVVGIAIARVLKNNGLLDVQLKWPNDIYWQNRKMGGILIETKQNRLGMIDAVIGIGLNIVVMDEYSAVINQKFVSLEDALCRKVYRDKIVAELLVELDQVLKTFVVHGFGAFTAEWQSLDAKIASMSQQDMDIFAKIVNAENLMADYHDKVIH